MNQVEIKAKMMALQEAIASALQNHTFEKELDVLKIQAAELNLSQADFNALVEQAKKTVSTQQNVAYFVGYHKKAIMSVLGVLVGLEWIIPILCGWKRTPIQSMEAVSSIDSTAIAETMEAVPAVVETTHETISWALPIGWGWILLINFVTILLFVLLLSVYINLKNKKH